MKINIERAKDNNLTCKIQQGDKPSQYIYSKYRPKNIVPIDVKDGENYVVLGLGLGYEVSFIAQRTKGKVYVIDSNKDFYNIINSYEELKEILRQENVIFLFGVDYQSVDLPKQYDIINNRYITQYNTDYYATVLEKLGTNKCEGHVPTIVVFEHITIAADCIDVLKNLGYNVKTLRWHQNKQMMKAVLLDYKPDYIMTINFDGMTSDICQEINKPYIAWVVDAPVYSMYGKEIKNSTNYIFHQDPRIVEEMRQKGIQNIYYMPVAANIKRIDSLIINAEDRERYACDISFIANLTSSEYAQYIRGQLTEETKEEMQNLIIKQSNNPNQFVLKKLCTQQHVEKIKKETTYPLRGSEYMTDAEKLAFLLGREQSWQQRISYIQQLSEHYKEYDMRIYGNELWKNYIGNYWGHAEHFEVMPKIMKLSKINLNITRTFVEAGLPMRIFDVLSVGGFLLTNYKEGLNYKFSLGKDFVIYRDLQDLTEIIDFYLQHEEERLEIAKHGMDTLKKYHTYEERIKKMMDKVNELLRHK